MTTRLYHACECQTPVRNDLCRTTTITYNYLLTYGLVCEKVYVVFIKAAPTMVNRLRRGRQSLFFCLHAYVGKAWRVQC